MKEISTLAESFRRSASGEAQRISKDLESGLKQLESATVMALKSSESSLLAALSDSEKAMSAAIRRQRRAQLWAYRWPLVLLTTLAFALTVWSGWQGVQIRQQGQLIAQGKQTLASLPVGWEVVRIQGRSYLQTSEGKPELRQHVTDKKTWFIALE